MESDAAASEMSDVDLVEWVDRVRQLTQASCRLCKKKKKKKSSPSKMDSQRRLTTGDVTATTANAAAEQIRRLNAAGVTATMTPGELIGAILTSVGVGTGGGGPLRRRSTSSPEAGSSAPGTSSTTPEGIREEDEDDGELMTSYLADVVLAGSAGWLCLLIFLICMFCSGSKTGIA